MKYIDKINSEFYNCFTMKMVNRQRLSNQTYQIIKEMIIEHRFQPGNKLNIEQIAKEVGTSRTPVWEAVHRLMQEGLLENIPNRGVFMAVLTPQVALELYTVREVLEGLAARLAVININEDAIRRMKICLDSQYRVILKEDMIGYSKLDFEFHAIVYELCGNRILQEMLESIKNKMRPIAMHINPILSRLFNDHCEILDAFSARNQELADRAFRNHNRQMIEHIKESMQNNSWKEVDRLTVNENGAISRKEEILLDI